MTTAIQVNELSKEYQRGALGSSGLLRDSMAQAFKSPGSLLRRKKKDVFWALKDVSFQVSEGEVLGLIGRNGSGKTTLLKILSRITRPTGGWAEIHGRVGSLLEVGTGFHPELTGRENTYLSGAILGMSKNEIRRKFDEIVAFAELEPFIDTAVKHYSSGMYVRLAFAVAAHLEPEILLVDEVLAVGDIRFQKKCLGKMGEVARGGRTIILVSHQLNQIRRLCERTLWIDSGTVRQGGPTADVVAAYESAMAAADRETESTGRAGQKAKFVSWRLSEASSDFPNRLETLGPVSVTFTLQVFSRLSRVHHGIALFDVERRLMWARSADDLSFEPGIHELTYEFPYLPLCPKPYSWQLSLWDGDRNLDLWEALPEFIIAAPNHQHAKDEWNGVLNAPSSLVIKAKDRP